MRQKASSQISGFDSLVPGGGWIAQKNSKMSPFGGRVQSRPKWSKECMRSADPYLCGPRCIFHIVDELRFGDLARGVLRPAITNKPGNLESWNLKPERPCGQRKPSFRESWCNAVPNSPLKYKQHAYIMWHQMPWSNNRQFGAPPAALVRAVILGHLSRVEPQFRTRGKKKHRSPNHPGA